jgi:hypothetical protein
LKKIIFAILILRFIIIFGNENKYPFISESDMVYAEIELNINGDKIPDYIVTVISKKDFNYIKKDPLYLPGIENVYFVISNNSGI